MRKTLISFAAVVVMAACAFSALPEKSPDAVQRSEDLKAIATDYQARLAALNERNQQAVQALNLQIQSESASDSREALQRQVMELKRQGEVDRLNLLLDWATAASDQDRVNEVSAALYNFTHPVQERTVPQLARDAKPGTIVQTPTQTQTSATSGN